MPKTPVIYLSALILLIVQINSNLLHAIELDEGNLPEEEVVAGNQLQLNGYGLRKVTIFRIRVYLMGLYLSSKQKDPDLIIADPKPKKIRMIFVRSVSAERLIDGLNESIEDNYPDYLSIKNELTLLNSNIRDVEEGDQLEFELFDDTTRVIFNRKDKIEITNKGLQTALLLIWLGPDPAGEDLKEALLLANN